MADIFISYAHEDRAHAERIARALEAEGWSVWWDRTRIPAGENFSRVIGEAIDSARCVVVLWSRASVASDWIRDEAGEGQRRNILMPVLIEHEVQVPVPFSYIQAAHLVRWDGSPADDEYRHFERSIAAVIDRSTHTARAAPATLWYAHSLWSSKYFPLIAVALLASLFVFTVRKRPIEITVEIDRALLPLLQIATYAGILLCLIGALLTITCQVLEIVAAGSILRQLRRVMTDREAGPERAS